MKGGDVRWVYTHNGAGWVWLQVRVKHVGREGVLVDYLDGSGSAIWPENELYERPQNG